MEFINFQFLNVEMFHVFNKTCRRKITYFIHFHHCYWNQFILNFKARILDYLQLIESDYLTINTIWALKLQYLKNDRWIGPNNFGYFHISLDFKGGQNWILRPGEKLVLDEKNKLLFIRPKTDNSFSTYRPLGVRRGYTSGRQEII